MQIGGDDGSHRIIFPSTRPAREGLLSRPAFGSFPNAHHLPARPSSEPCPRPLRPGCLGYDPLRVSNVSYARPLEPSPAPPRVRRATQLSVLPSDQRAYAGRRSNRRPPLGSSCSARPVPASSRSSSDRGSCGGRLSPEGSTPTRYRARRPPGESVFGDHREPVRRNIRGEPVMQCRSVGWKVRF